MDGLLGEIQGASGPREHLLYRYRGVFCLELVRRNAVPAVAPRKELEGVPLLQVVGQIYAEMRVDLVCT